MTDAKLRPTETEIALPVPQIPGGLKTVNVGIMRHPDYDGPGMLTSLPMASDEDRSAAFNVVAGDAEAMKDHADEVLAITDYVLERGTFEFEDSPGPELGVRIWLIDAEGRRYFNGSRSIGQCMERVLTWFGMGPWSPPLLLKFTRGETSNGRPWWNVERHHSLKKTRAKK